MHIIRKTICCIFAINTINFEALSPYVRTSMMAIILILIRIKSVVDIHSANCAIMRRHHDWRVQRALNCIVWTKHGNPTRASSNVVHIVLFMCAFCIIGRWMRATYKSKHRKGFDKWTRKTGSVVGAIGPPATTRQKLETMTGTRTTTTHTISANTWRVCVNEKVLSAWNLLSLTVASHVVCNRASHLSLIRFFWSFSIWMAFCCARLMSTFFPPGSKTVDGLR